MDQDEPKPKRCKIEESNVKNNSTRLESPVCEKDVGIHCYITSGFTPFQGIVKQRFSDFVVNEIDMKGELVRLTTKGLEEDIGTNTNISTANSTTITTAATMSSTNVSSMESTTNLVANTDNTACNTTDSTASVDCKDAVSVDCKDTMSVDCKVTTSDTVLPAVDTPVDEVTSGGAPSNDDAHTIANQITTDVVAQDCPLPAKIVNGLKNLEVEKSLKFEAPQEKVERKKIHDYVKSQFPAVCSNCITVDGVKYLEFILKSSVKNTDPRNKEGCWPRDRPTHLHFVLYKEFKDTMEAIDIISKYSGIKPQHFNYAGTKDRRAKTSQRISAHKVKAEKLQAVNAKLRGMAMGNFRYLNERLALGQLSGNRFKIVLRNVETTADNLRNAAESLQQSGFINYFGMQRFGTASIPTYQVGLHILKSEFDKAVDLIMAPRSTDKPHVTNVRLLWSEKRDATAVLNKLPRSMNIERRLMEGVVKCGVTNPLGALDRIPRTTRLLYLHSYQSLIWNKAASVRIEKYGMEPMVGDLVYVEEPSVDPDTLGEDDSQQPDSMETRNKPVVKHLTEEDLPNYTIYDIVLPLPGYSVVLPDNELKGVMIDLIAEDGLTLDSLRTNKKSKQYRLPGSYRRVVIRPIDLTSSLTFYDDATEELVQSDMDILNKQVLTQKKIGKYKAAILEFGLPSSCYATMLLREVMRIDTSAAHQSSLNVT